MSITQKLRMTEGQLYSAIIVLVVSVLLLFGLGDLHGVAGSALAAQPLPLAPVPSGTAAPGQSGVVAVPPGAPLPAGPTGLFPAPAPAPAPFPTDETPAYVPSTPPTARPTASPTTPPSTCTVSGTQGGYDQGISVLEQVNQATGGALPAKDVELTLGVITGCNAADPAVVAVGLLIGIGHTLPNPGIPNPVVLPFVPIPPAVVAAVQPARAVIDQACGLIGTGQTVESLFISAYPQPVPQLTTQVLFTALSICGQVRQP